MRSEWTIKAPLTINWAVNNSCNFSCKHCYSRSDESQELSFDELCQAMGKAAKAGVLAVNFGGGEPLLRHDLPSLAAFARSCGMRVTMNSNGYLLDAQQARVLKEFGFYKVGISIDSHVPEVHDSFRGVPGSHRRAIEALAHLREVGIKTSISTVICRINHLQVEELVALATECGVEQLNFHNFKCSGLGLANKDDLDLNPEEWREFYRKALALRSQPQGVEISLDDPIISSLGPERNPALVKGSVCGKLSLNIKTNGDITPCGFIPMVIGNILRDDLSAVWHESEVLYRMRHKTATGKCASCGSYEDCLGGCSARALALTGDLNSPDPHCWAS
ncbi:GeoRSP system radical SAM/SPASM protein [Geomonas sp. RF6]|uniref:GeoRSP system radical SAM/SPASM protein n=1 Tax=Geomonas sp. RF6 TaxID=2897342 RepID=UPI001E42F6FB|nr:GeoRSP system radical SAM/SPASM protein [Geomonas sp. RF6]UFS70313.1 GeoRSP system radical SAM/SPASM protein [Geomonas sp. RF6]